MEGGTGECSATSTTKSHSVVKMRWTNEHDLLFLKEVLTSDVLKHKSGSRQRGCAWDLIAGILNSIEKPKFKIDQRALREHLNKLLREYTRKKNYEEKASGIEVEVTELDNLLEEVLQMKNEQELIQENEADERKKSVESEKKAADDVRRKSLETWSETRKREKNNSESDISDSESSSKRRRNSGSDSVNFLREKSQMEFEMRNKELEFKKQELELQKEKEENANQRCEQMLRFNQQQNQALLQQNQQQTQALMLLLAKLADKS